MTVVRRAVVFLDWDTARRIAPRERTIATGVKQAARQIDKAFEKLQDLVAAHLQQLDTKVIFRVRWRVYHGWFTGRTKTGDYLAMESYIMDAGTRTIGKVSFGADVEVATSLLIGGRRMPLYDTLRTLTETDGTVTVRQKMVDTALMCDLLQSARSASDDVHIIYGSDDDLLPGVFAAEAWGASVHMYRPNAGSRFLDTKNLVTVIEATR